MKKSLSLSILLSLVLGVGLLTLGNRNAAADAAPSAVADQIIARERASFEAWQRKDKAFFENFLADDATYFSWGGPYLETDPKQNFLPKFEKYAEMMKFNDYQMYNARVQLYGDTAILTYNSSVSATFGGQPINYTAKVTSVYAKQGNTWRVVHGHESMNPSPK